MTEAQIKEAIVKMNNSEEYLSLRKYYAEESFIKILHMSREEKVHSNFIAWLLNPDSHHELHYFPLQKLLQLLAIISQKDINSKCDFPSELSDRFLLEDYTFSQDSMVMVEVDIGEVIGFRKKGRLDILLLLRFKDSDKTLPIIIENKVLSTENQENDDKKQTQKYYEWGIKEYSDEAKYEKPIFVFLAPDYERDIKCSCESYVKMSYQNLVDYVIEPCLINTTSEQAKIFIKNYLRCLSNTSLTKTTSRKEGRIMAFSSREKELLEKFHEKNKDLFDAVLTMLENDEETSDEDRARIRAVRKVSNSRDNSKYLFDGEKYRKGRLVLAVIKKYFEENPKVSFSDLEKVFPKKLRGGSGVVQLFDSVSPEDRGENGATKRYYVEKDEEIILDNGDVVLVSNQWGGADKMDKFIAHVEEKLKYTIIKL